MWIRVHVQPRRAMLTPVNVTGGPDPEDLSYDRHTELIFEDGEREDIDDTWQTKEGHWIRDRAWTGTTTFRPAGCAKTRIAVAAAGRVHIEEENAIKLRKTLKGTIPQPSLPGEGIVGKIIKKPPKDSHGY